jgi:hypothetical protein
MKRILIQLSFKDLSDPMLLTKANFISSSIKNNPLVFPSPQPTLQVVDDAIAVYSQAYYNADGGSKLDIENKANARKALERILFSLGLWAMFITDCGENIGLSGFTVAKERQRRTLAGLGNATLRQGSSSGEIAASVPRGNATSFNFEITDAPPNGQTIWKAFKVTTSQFVFQGLVPGRQYYIRVAAIGNRRQLVYSNVGTETAKL